MFTGIIENIGSIEHLETEKDNLHITVKSTLTPQLKIDQSVAHNGVCLTVVNIKNSSYIVTAIKETLNKTTLKDLNTGDAINLERAMTLGNRLDGHIVQGHVDEIATCTKIEEANGSWVFSFKYNFNTNNNITIEKGSITINGVSLTVIDSKKESFSVAIIPYTYNHTNFKQLKVGDSVNLEFDLIGKYVKRLKEFNL